MNTDKTAREVIAAALRRSGLVTTGEAWEAADIVLDDLATADLHLFQGVPMPRPEASQ